MDYLADNLVGLSLGRGKATDIMESERLHSVERSREGVDVDVGIPGSCGTFIPRSTAVSLIHVDSRRINQVPYYAKNHCNERAIC